MAMTALPPSLLADLGRRNLWREIYFPTRILVEVVRSQWPATRRGILPRSQAGLVAMRLARYVC